MNAYTELLDSDRRLVILRSLEEDAGYTLNESVLHSILEAMGHRVSRDRVRTDMEWLAEQGLVTTHEVVSVKVATITGRGADVACGRATVPGVKRPRPKGM